MEQSGDFLKEIEEKLKNCVDHLVEEYKSMQVGRANPAILNKVKVDYYGTPTAINQLATVSVPEARVLSIVPWDVTVIKLIETAIQKANIGINPTSDGKVIRLIFPQLTGERREEIVKEIKVICENFRIQIRNCRKKFLSDVRKLHSQNEISDDEQQMRENEIQNLVDKYDEKIREIYKNKEDEVKSI